MIPMSATKVDEVEGAAIRISEWQEETHSVFQRTMQTAQENKDRHWLIET